MSILTIAPTLLGGQDPEYYAGRADAYDEHAAGTTLTELLVRAEHIGNLHPSKAYGLGYHAYVAGARLEHNTQQDNLRASITHNNDYWTDAATT